MLRDVLTFRSLLAVTPRQPVVHQEFEVSYMADREIGSIEMQHWDVLPFRMFRFQRLASPPERPG